MMPFLQLINRRDELLHNNEMGHDSTGDYYWPDLPRIFPPKY